MSQRNASFQERTTRCHTKWPRRKSSEKTHWRNQKELVHVVFNVIEEVPQELQNDHEPIKPSNICKWLHLHEKLGHMSWNQMKLLVEVWILPKKYQNCKALKCPRCLYGKQHRTPWHTSKRNHKVKNCIKTRQLCLCQHYAKFSRWICSSTEREHPHHIMLC